MMGSSTIGSTTMPFENSHVGAVGNLWIAIKIVFKCGVGDIGLEIEGLLCTDHIMASCFLNQWESLSRNCCSKHPYGIATIAIAILITAIDAGLGRP